MTETLRKRSAPTVRPATIHRVIRGAGGWIYEISRGPYLTKLDAAKAAHAALRLVDPVSDGDRPPVTR